MLKLEYVTKRNELQRQLIELKNEYIKSNSVFPYGTKVKTTPSVGEAEYGFVIGYECDALNNVVPIVAKMTKNGTPHKTARLYVGSSKIEACD